MSDKINFGKLGEDLAANFLLDKGYRLLERNWRNHHKEIDIIAEDDGRIVVVEVKTRKSDDFGEPELAVNSRKQSLLISAANAYILSKGLDCEVRFDIISIVIKDGEPCIDHIEDAFQPRF